MPLRLARAYIQNAPCTKHHIRFQCTHTKCTISHQYEAGVALGNISLGEQLT